MPRSQSTARSEELRGFQRNKAWLESISSLQDFRWSETAPFVPGPPTELPPPSNRPSPFCLTGCDLETKSTIWLWSCVLSHPEGLARPEQSCPGKSSTGEGVPTQFLEQPAKIHLPQIVTGSPRTWKMAGQGMVAEATAELVWSLQVKWSNSTIGPSLCSLQPRGQANRHCGRKTALPDTGGK